MLIRSILMATIGLQLNEILQEVSPDMGDRGTLLALSSAIRSGCALPGSMLLFGDSPQKGRQTMAGILYAIVVILIVLWLLGFLVVHVASPFIHLLLVVGVIVLAYQLLTGRRAV